VEEKFSTPKLAEKLIATDDREIIYDTKHPIWGSHEGKGENLLGNLIMEFRNRLR